MTKTFVIALAFCVATLGPSARASAEASASPPIPASEREFIGIFSAAQAQLNSTGTMQARTAVRMSMQVRQARFMRASPNAQEWIGEVRDQHVTPDGLGCLRIVIAPGVTLMTAPDRTADPGAITLIRQWSPLYRTLRDLHTGDMVVFNARLIGGKLESDEDMVEEAQVLVRFSAIKPAG